MQDYGNPFFVERLLLLMTEHELNQEQLATALDQPRQEIADWLYEGKVPEDAVLEKGSVLFDLATDYLLGNCDIKQHLRQ